MIRFCFLSAAVSIAACTESPATFNPPEAQPSVATGPVVRVPYNLDTPDATFGLPDELEEASALTVLPSGRLATVQDEDGIVYEVDPETGLVVSRTPFEGPGDFEGIEWVNGALWVLRSDGTLFRIVEGQRTEVVETLLTDDADTEGLAWDPQRGRLLIACKDDPGNGLKGVRAIYEFDPDAVIMNAVPTITLNRDEVDADDDFRPSGLAVHPITGETYVLSSRRRAIAVVDTEGQLVGVSDLPVELNAQPEGIAFLPDGTMFIQNEAGEDPASIQRFAMVRE